MATKLTLKEKSVEDLTKMLAEKREELRTLRFSTVSRSVKDTTDPRKMRADIARIMTELGSRAKKTA
ncbi:MAG TPA: 50S ribosomal protein L29 [Candidatus Paceibacterota bacterium]|nr:50S ribosomal protein L29 [Candidatus Paceibacterota bacterium]